jgi:predicted Zn-dependent protease
MSASPRRWRWRLPLALLLLVALGCAVSVFIGRRVSRTAAQEAERNHRFEDAERSLETCRRLHVTDAETQRLAARVARRRDDLDEAERRLDTLDAAHGITPEGALERGLVKAQRLEVSEAERRHLNELVQKNHPDSAGILEVLAKVALKQYRFPEALYSLDQLIEKDPGHVPAFVLRGRLWDAERKYDEARQDFEKAVELQPDNATARLYLADTLVKLGETRLAVSHYEYLRARPPVNPSVIVGLARCRHNLHEMEEARTLLDSLLSSDPENNAAVAEWGQVMVRSGRPAEAESRLRAAVRRAPHDRLPRLALYLCLDAQGKTDEAAEEFAKLRQNDDDNARLVVLWSRIATNDPEHLALRVESAVILLRLGRDKEAERWLLSALAQDARYRPAHEVLAAHYARTGRADMASPHRAALAQLPGGTHE